MIGLVKGLFQSKSQRRETADSTQPASPQTSRPVAQPKPAQPEPKPVAAQPVASRTGGAFYLDSDEAKTFGNLEYMRSSRSVRRTFPKEKLGKDNALMRTISATEAARLNTAMPETTPAIEAGSNGAQSGAQLSKRRSGDSSLDMFRNMAREIKKG